MNRNEGWIWEILSPLFLANLYISSYEICITEKFLYILKVWYRYVDDIFSMIKKQHTQEALKLLNLQEQIFNNNNNNNNKIQFDIFRKDIHTDSYIKQSGFNIILHKHSVINSLV